VASFNQVTTGATNTTLEKTRQTLRLESLQIKVHKKRLDSYYELTSFSVNVLYRSSTEARKDSVMLIFAV